jgi:phosphoribosylamine---glycine ligase
VNTTSKSNVLIVGSGGREHALGWKIRKSKHVENLYFAPGNGGTSVNIDIDANEFGKLKLFAKQKSCLTIVGPETPLSRGVVDLFFESGLSIFGPIKAASKLEASKSFAKKFMNNNGIRTAKYSSFSDADRAKDYVVRQTKKLVIKADGLASGKGVFVCNTTEEALNAVHLLMTQKKFGSAGNRIIVEERLEGEEVSFIGLSDGKTVIPLASSRDHKRLFDNDKGPNTGGMGSYSPAYIIDDRLHKEIMYQIMTRTVDGMRHLGTPFVGFLYAGLIIEKNTGKPYVLEYNVRMGDPECQAIIMRMKSDLFEYVDAAINRKLESMPVMNWDDQYSVCIIMCAKGYPGDYRTGHTIRGLYSQLGDKVVIFHSGTRTDSHDNIFTNGGRVLGVTSLGKGLSEAISNAYSATEKISWGNGYQYYRKDIGK